MVNRRSLISFWWFRKIIYFSFHKNSFAILPTCPACSYAQHVPLPSMFLCLACSFSQHVPLAGMFLHYLCHVYRFVWSLIFQFNLPNNLQLLMIWRFRPGSFGACQLFRRATVTVVTVRWSATMLFSIFLWQQFSCQTPHAIGTKLSRDYQNKIRIRITRQQLVSSLSLSLFISLPLSLSSFLFISLLLSLSLFGKDAAHQRDRWRWEALNESLSEQTLLKAVLSTWFGTSQ